MKQILVTYRQYVLVFAIIVLLAICYRLAFKHTLSAFQERQSLRKDLINNGTGLIEPEFLVRKLANLNLLVKSYQFDTTGFRNDVIGRLAQIAAVNSVQLVAVPKAEAGYGNNRVMMQRLEMSGNFFDLLKVYHQTGKTPGTGFIRSATWRKVIDRDAKKSDSKVMLELFVTGIK